MDANQAEELLRRALLDPSDAAAVALRVGRLSLSGDLTVVFHGRRDLGTINTYLAYGRRRAGASVTPADLMRVPCDLDLSDASGVDEARELYAHQAGILRTALASADTVLSIWREPLQDLIRGQVGIDRRTDTDIQLPAHRFLPIALSAPESQLQAFAVCNARLLKHGAPPVGIALAQGDLSQIYALTADPEDSIEHFQDLAIEHAMKVGRQLERQSISVKRFLELSDD